LGLALAFAAGCGGSATPEQAQAPAGEPLKPAPGPDPKPADPATPPAPAAGPPLAGELDGQPFAPAAEFQDGVLYFRGLRPGGFPDNRVIELRLTPEQVKKPDGLKLTVTRVQ